MRDVSCNQSFPLVTRYSSLGLVVPGSTEHTQPVYGGEGGVDGQVSVARVGTGGKG